MAEPAASQRGRIAALLKKLPSKTAYRLVEAVGLFAPLASLIDRTSPVDAADRDAETGRVSPRSLPAIWRWLSESVAPDAAGVVLETLARTAMGRSQAQGLPPLPKLRAQLGREGMAAFDHQSFNEIAEALGSRRAAHDALLVCRTLAISEQIEALRVLLPPQGGALQPSALKVAREIAEREPECKSALACAIIGQTSRTADAAPLLLALARRRDEHRLDRSDLAPALTAAIEVAAARGTVALQPGGDSSAALAAAQLRARDAVDLAAALRGHVTDDWVRRLNERLGETGRAVGTVCEESAALVRDALGCPEHGVSSQSAERAVAAAGFLSQSEPIAATLRFEIVRRRTFGDALATLESEADAAEERLHALAQRDLDAATRYVELRARLIEQLQDARAARAWLRRGRRIIGRPTFSEHVLESIEPVIVDDGVALRGGCITRDVADALWEWASAGPLAEARRDAEARFEAERDNDPRAAAEIAAQYRPLLADAVRAALTDGAASFEQDALAQLAILAALLESEPVIAARLEAWPHRIKHVAEQHIADVRALHDELSAIRPEIEPALLVLIMGRLDRPWQILRMLERIARTNSDILVEATEFVSIGEILIDRAEADAASFRPAGDEPFNADHVLARLERFAGIASGMTEEFQIRRNGKWGSRFYSLKSQAARDLEEMCKAAVAAVEAATPKQPSVVGMSPADVARPPDEARAANAAQYARFLRGSKVLDHRAAFAGARSAALSRVDARLIGHVESLLSLAHSGDNREGALSHLRALADIVGEFEGFEARDIVLRRAAAA